MNTATQAWANYIDTEYGLRPKDLPYRNLTTNHGDLRYEHIGGKVRVLIRTIDPTEFTEVTGPAAHPIARAILNECGLLICRHNRECEDLWQCEGCNQMLLPEDHHRCLTQQAIDTLEAIR